jgi:hypothetical protein
MSRQTTGQFGVDPNVRCARVYPVPRSRKQIAELKSVGLKLTRDQARHLAQALFAASKHWDEIDITAYRTPRKSDKSHHVTVTSLSNDTPMRATELLPCPFCGQPATLHQLEENLGPNSCYWVVGCATNECPGSFFYGQTDWPRKIDASQAWNTRA